MATPDKKPPVPKPKPTITSGVGVANQLAQQGNTTSAPAVSGLTGEDVASIANNNGAQVSSGIIQEHNATLKNGDNLYALYVDPYGNTSVQTFVTNPDTTKTYLGGVVPINRNGKVDLVSIDDVVAEFLQTSNPEALKQQLFQRGLITQDDMAKDINDRNVVAGIQQGLNALAINNFSAIQKNDVKSIIDPKKFTSFLSTYEPGMAYRNLLTNKQKAYADIKASAYANGVNLPDSFINNNADAIVNAKPPPSKVQDNISSIAKNLYPTFADGLDSGIDLNVLTQDYIRSTKNILELTDDDIALTNPKSPLRKALSAKDANGKPSRMDLGDYERSLYKDPRWMETTNAAQSFQNVYSTLSEALR